MWQKSVKWRLQNYNKEKGWLEIVLSIETVTEMQNKFGEKRWTVHEEDLCYCNVTGDTVAQMIRACCQTQEISDATCLLDMGTWELAEFRYFSWDKGSEIGNREELPIARICTISWRFVVTSGMYLKNNVLLMVYHSYNECFKWLLQTGWPDLIVSKRFFLIDDELKGWRAKCGLYATIILYEAYNDETVQEYAIMLYMRNNISFSVVDESVRWLCSKSIIHE